MTARTEIRAPDDRTVSRPGGALRNTEAGCLVTHRTRVARRMGHPEHPPAAPPLLFARSAAGARGLGKQGPHGASTSDLSQTLPL